MSKLLFSLIFAWKVVQILASSSHHCPYWVNEKIQDCVRPVAQFAKSINKQENSSSTNTGHHEFGDAISIRKLGGQVFQELCGLIDEFDKCVTEPRKLCPKHIMISLIDASYGFLCKEGYETFMSSAECLMELDHKPSVKHCHDETLADIERASAEAGITMPVKLDRMCDALNFFSGCVRTPIRHNCGVAAWAVIFRVLRDTTNTLMPNCQFTGQSRKLYFVTTTEAPPFRGYKPTIIQITPRLIEATEGIMRGEQGYLPSRKPELRAARTQDLDSESLYYSSKKSTSRQGERPSPEKLEAGKSPSLRHSFTIILFFTVLARLL